MSEKTSLHLVPANDIPLLVSILKDADEDVSRIISIIRDSTNSAYLVFDHSTWVGAVVMHWHPQQSEILYIAMDSAYRGQGYGKASIALLTLEAQSRQVQSLIVGTANSSLDNIAFYQKCGFRMDSIRRDYFDYLPAPVYEEGILMRDMLVLRMEVSAAPSG